MPRAITGPESSGCLVIWPSSTPGWSVANVRSTTIARSGSWGERARARARERGLLLGDRHCQDVSGRAAALGHQPRGLRGDVTADAVVERARHHPPVPEVERLGVDHAHVADPDELGGLLAIFGADVDVELLQLGNLLAVLVLEQVNRLAADQTHDVAVPASSVSRAGRSEPRRPSRLPARTAGSHRPRCARRAARSRRCGRRPRAWVRRRFPRHGRTRNRPGRRRPPARSRRSTRATPVRGPTRGRMDRGGQELCEQFRDRHATEGYSLTRSIAGCRLRTGVGPGCRG